MIMQTEDPTLPKATAQKKPPGESPVPPQSRRRKIVQLVSAGGVLCCLATDATVWILAGDRSWTKVKELPQTEDKEP